MLAPFWKVPPWLAFQRPSAMTPSPFGNPPRAAIQPFRFGLGPLALGLGLSPPSPTIMGGQPPIGRRVAAARGPADVATLLARGAPQDIAEIVRLIEAGLVPAGVLTALARRPELPSAVRAAAVPKTPPLVRAVAAPETLPLAQAANRTMVLAQQVGTDSPDGLALTKQALGLAKEAIKFNEGEGLARELTDAIGITQPVPVGSFDMPPATREAVEAQRAGERTLAPAPGAGPPLFAISPDILSGISGGAVAAMPTLPVQGGTFTELPGGAEWPGATIDPAILASPEYQALLSGASGGSIPAWSAIPADITAGIEAGIAPAISAFTPAEAVADIGAVFGDVGGAAEGLGGILQGLGPAFSLANIGLSAAQGDPLGAGLGAAGGAAWFLPPPYNIIAGIGIPVIGGILRSLGLFDDEPQKPSAAERSAAQGQAAAGAFSGALTRAQPNLGQLLPIINRVWAPHGEFQIGSFQRPYELTQAGVNVKDVPGHIWQGDWDDPASPGWGSALERLRRPETYQQEPEFVKNFIRGLWVQGPGQTGAVPYNPTESRRLQEQFATATAKIPGFQGFSDEIGAAWGAAKEAEAQRQAQIAQAAEVERQAQIAREDVVWQRRGWQIHPSGKWISPSSGGELGERPAGLPEEVISAQEGGSIPETGIYRLHAGEFVIPASVVHALENRAPPSPVSGREEEKPWFLDTKEGPPFQADANPDPSRTWRLATSPAQLREALDEGEPVVAISRDVLYLPPQRAVPLIERARKAQYDQTDRGIETLGALTREMAEPPGPFGLLHGSPSAPQPRPTRPLPLPGNLLPASFEARGVYGRAFQGLPQALQTILAKQPGPSPLFYDETRPETNLRTGRWEAPMGGETGYGTDIPGPAGPGAWTWFPRSGSAARESWGSVTPEQIARHELTHLGVTPLLEGKEEQALAERFMRYPWPADVARRLGEAHPTIGAALTAPPEPAGRIIPDILRRARSSSALPTFALNEYLASLAEHGGQPRRVPLLPARMDPAGVLRHLGLPTQ